MYTDFAASLFFYVLPYLTGRIFVKPLSQAWLTGALIWFLTFFIASGLSLLKILDFQTIIKLSSVIYIIAATVRIAFDFIKNKPKVNPKTFFIVAFIACFTSILYFFLWKKVTPYPLQLNWDIYEHITLANEISLGKMHFVTTQLSDTFTVNSYSTIFGVLLSLPKVLFEQSLSGLYWFVEYWHFLFTALASFLLAKRVFKSNWYALTAAITSSLVFESTVSYTSLFLIPQTMVAVLTALVVSEIKSYKLPMLIIAGAVLFLLHYVVGLMAIVVITAFYLSQRLKLSVKTLNLAILAATVVSVGLILSNFFLNLSVPGMEEAEHFTFSAFQKIGLINQWYSLLFLPFVLIGYIKILKSEELSLKTVLIVALLGFGISFAPFSYFLKFYTLEHFFINLVIVSGIGALIFNLSKFARVLAIAFLTMIMTVNLYNNLLLYKDPLHFKGYETQISFEEIEAGTWLFNLPQKENAFIISDPATQYILEAISGVNSQGGVYMSLATRKTLEKVYGSYDPEYIKTRLNSIEDALSSDNPKNRRTLYVVGGRYFAWQRLPGDQKKSSFYNIWSPRILTENDINYINYLKRYFKVVYENNQIVIFEIK